MIYFDGLHLMSDESLKELHSFARSIGLKKVYLHWSREDFPHYDVWGNPKEKILKDKNVKVLKRIELLKLYKEGKFDVR